MYEAEREPDSHSFTDVYAHICYRTSLDWQTAVLRQISTLRNKMSNNHGRNSGLLCVLFFLIKNQNITKKKNLKAKKQNTNISAANRIVRKHILSFQLLIQEQKKEINNINH